MAANEQDPKNFQLQALPFQQPMPNNVFSGTCNGVTAVTVGTMGAVGESIYFRDNVHSIHIFTDLILF